MYGKKDCRRSIYIISVLANLTAPVSGHGYIAGPPARRAGPVTSSVCGPLVAADILRDNTSHVEGLPELAARDPSYNSSACDLWLCRGIQLEPEFTNTTHSNNGTNGTNGAGYGGDVQHYKSGEAVRVQIHLTIPHSGTANVSIVDTATNTVVPGGGLLAYWERGYANEKDYYGMRLPLNQTDFEITMPELGGRCERQGECVLQWWWFAKAARQTYESCVDFVMLPAWVNVDSIIA
ncbi:hypothetical protein QBC46DRAFT_460307 [Diplogelasinospora grovesii]|uniref:Chitin-binding type-4 domain-containing protein n=1 Tax=Diplogelasinospora grovesii TaxID=303347 RepID=A0AAN6N524_9PEZI|nr:hypothetical protein QBC46DRAFT_460307 [Diplogelasinospora grovesii]